MMVVAPANVAPRCAELKIEAFPALRRSGLKSLMDGCKVDSARSLGVVEDISVAACALLNASGGRTEVRVEWLPVKTNPAGRWLSVNGLVRLPLGAGKADNRVKLTRR